MKKITFLFLCAVMALSLISPMAGYAHAPNGQNNLIANPSVEQEQDVNTPTFWHSNSWGSNSAVFSYQNVGNTGSKSLKTEVTSYTDGDAKWYFEPVTVEAGSTYIFGDYYQSNTNSEVVVQYTKADNSNTYVWLGALSAASSWTDKDFEFTVPAGVIKLSVFHVIASVGWLAVDDYSLVKSMPDVIPPSSSLVPNESLEQASVNNPNQPVKWLTNSWGNNTAVFDYMNEGRTGSKSAKTTLSSYQSGDAKWYFEPVAISPSTNYTFTDYYKSSVTTHVVAAVYDAAGNPTYIDLASGVAPSASDWQLFTKSFVTPANASKLSVFHVIESVGWLQIDDVAIETGQTIPPEPPLPPPPTTGNLIINPDLETGNSSPQGWTSNNWGAISASHQYGSFGLNGSKALKTTVTNYTNGDAKWYFEPVSVKAGSNYTYSHYYQSDINTEVVAQYTDQNGGVSYAFLGSIVPSANFKQYTQNLTIPADAKKLSIFHCVVGVGNLTIDNASLVEVAPPAPSANPIPNSSLESESAGQPTGWNSNKWGTNTASFQYMNEGRTGTRSVKTTVTNYTNGDAKWYFTPISLQPGSQYRFKVWYKTNTLPQPVAMFTLNDGSTIYSGLPAPQPAGNSATVWQQYSDTFSVPTNAVTVSVFMYVNTNGWLQTDDYEISPYQVQGFSRGLVTLTFDDGWEDNLTTALPLMESYGFDSTQCYATTFIEDADNEQAAINSVLAFRDAGHEICSHTVTHPFLTQLTTANATYELAHSKAYLEAITGQTIKNFASPYGDYNASVNSLISQYYQAHRTVDEGYNSKDNFDIYRLRVQNMLSTTTIAEYQSWLDEAARTNTWLILVYHRVANDPGTYDTYQSSFTAQMAALNASGLTVKTYDAALAELLPQL